MNFTRKIDRARQWAGEKMGAEVKATHTSEFKALEADIEARHAGMDRLHKSMNNYTRWVGRRCEGAESRSRNTPVAVLGQTMVAHGAEIERDSDFGRCLISTGNTYERMAELQNSYLDCANATWAQQIERNLAMMKEYQSARKKLENRRLAYDATMAKMQKGKQDTRIEEELRVNKTKFDDTTEDVYSRMQDIKETEADSIAALTSFLDAELEYHEQAASEIRRLREILGGTGAARPSSSREELEYQGDLNRAQPQLAPPLATTIAHPASAHTFSTNVSPTTLSPSRPLARTFTSRPPPPPPPAPSSSSRPPVLARAATYDTRRPSRASAYSRDEASPDDASTCSEENNLSPADHSLSPATSSGSLACASVTTAAKKVPPPPPVSRARKPPPPPVPRKINTGY